MNLIKLWQMRHFACSRTRFYQLSTPKCGMKSLRTKVRYETENSEVIESDTTQLQDIPSQLNVYENQNVIIAQHIRVPETDRRRLTFGTVGIATELDSLMLQPQFQLIGATEKSNGESTTSLTAPASELSTDNVSGSKQVNLSNDHVRSSESESPASGVASEQQLPDNKEFSSSQNLDNYANVGLVLSPHQEVLNSHAANNVTKSSTSRSQQETKSKSTLQHCRINFEPIMNLILSQAYEMILEGVIVGLLLVLLWQEKGMQCKAREVDKFLRNGQGKGGFCVGKVFLDAKQRLRQLFVLNRFSGQKNAKPGQGMVGQRVKLLWYAGCFQNGDRIVKARQEV
ncbi:hypothetical protein KIW84_050185 [Lathyrus oleraceus]|uniref:Uncharacterized protein n=1 Tax=Pisum sativum TaxID=3888 RepID=A0A9D4WJ46_PEA|nr:hypothetical protein KIW84_050185 [Pisum sativum]